MSGWDEATARKVLEGVVSDELLESYCRLIALDGCSPRDSDELLGGSDVVRRLQDRGMAYLWSNPDRIVPAAPDLVLHSTLIELQRQLAESHQRLLTGHQRLGDVARALPQTTALPDHLVQIVTDREEIKSLSYSLINLATRDWMTLENLLQEVPMDQASCIPPLPVFGEDVRCRSIYESRITEHPAGAQILAAAVEAGEEARLLPRVDMKLKLADENAALLPLTPTGMSGALFIRSSVIVGALREYFEMLWQRATPIGAVEPEDGINLSDAQKRVLQLLAAGLQDDAIAARLKLSVHTVRRHITTMREMLDVESRFGMGAAAVRRGWIR